MLATQGSAAPPIVLQLSARSSPELTPRKPAAEKLSASPQEEEPADSLAKQLRALQAAKVDAAAKQVKGDQLIAQRQDQLRKETFSALSADNLGDLLRRWGPPPEQPADWETPRSRHETLAESPVPVVEESPREAVDESQDQMLEELPKEPPAEVEEQEPPSEPAPSLPAHERAKQVSKASTGSARTADGEACKESTQSLNRSSRGRRPSSLSLPAEDARRCAAELAVMARNVSAKEIRELRMLKRPPEAVMKLLEALRVVLGEKDLKPANFRKLLSDSLAQRLAAVDVASIGNARGAKLRSLLSSPDVSAEAVSRTCRPGTSLAEWCGCLYSFLCRPQDQPDPASTEQRIAETTDKPQVENSTPRPVMDHSKLIVEPDLSQMSSEELAEVYDLTVTKPDIGSVVFHGVTDCRDLDIAQTVVLKRGYVLVYPDPAKKPPPGEGLNKHATVTMYQCFPPGGHVKDEQALADYKVKIKKMTEEKSACTFIDYDCLTGVWTFEVERF